VGNSRVAIKLSRTEFEKYQRRFRSIPVIGADRLQWFDFLLAFQFDLGVGGMVVELRLKRKNIISENIARTPISCFCYVTTRLKTFCTTMLYAGCRDAVAIIHSVCVCVCVCEEGLGSTAGRAVGLASHGYL